MEKYQKIYEARKIITDILHDDLVGPVHKDEVLTELPTQYYVMGKIYPNDNTDEALDMASDDILENQTDCYDSAVSLSNQRNPSSFGITCALLAGVRKIRVTGSYAMYEPQAYPNADAAGIDISKWKGSDKHPDTFWVRREYVFNQIVAFNGNEHKRIVLDLQNGVELHVYTQHFFEDGIRVITIVMLNTNCAEKKPASVAKSCLFQPMIKVSGSDAEAVFTEVSRKEQVSNDEELLDMDLLYSDVHSFGQGHGCSVVWDQNHKQPLWVASSWFPSYNLHQMKAAELGESAIFSMKYLSEGEPAQVLSGLREFLQKYKIWIDNLKKDAVNLPIQQKQSAEHSIAGCEQAYHRMMRSVDLLEKDTRDHGATYRAFQMANEAMLMQREQTLRKRKTTVRPEEITWYPFQLAFILHELSSFIDPQGKERKVVDLLWFPTGGGKTEAYLGIAAFAIFLRRLRNPSDDGVTVMMRYTLRLLTLQQFERASILICACELLRRKYNLGGSEISIGLWVGQGLTPNTLKEARPILSKLQAGDVVDGQEKSSPCQLQICPWCGQPLTPDDYQITMDDRRMRIHCSNESCAFHDEKGEGLPVHIVDEAIYAYLPTFLVATVDKFAQIPLSDKPAALFGISSSKTPPDLIIQDELHLISGPLGTMTGIYEAAISKLCENNGVGAKIIGSTATIRNAKKQIQSLYGKEYAQFPPQGLSAKDSFFAIESEEDDRPTREYFGVMGIGMTATTTLIRVNADLLFGSRYLEALGYDDTVIDSFWTITNYFNSLRELGGASTYIIDDVQSRFRYLAKTKFHHLRPHISADMLYDNMVELTSRMNNSEITKVIQKKLNRSYRNHEHSDVYDFVLASNMISVGVDVGRLGIMAVTGQPKTNAEYIQATSRVGRANPGLVITVYNAGKSRDRSHYEQFMKYHSALYRYVEATSLTPFADRARDRGLHALYVSLYRYLVPGMLGNDAAVNFKKNGLDAQRIRSMILQYVDIVDPDEHDSVERELRDIEEEWDYQALGSLAYKVYDKEKRCLLKNDIEDDRFRTMNSLRSVGAQSSVYLLGR